MVYSVTYFTKILHAPFAIVETQNLFAILIALILTPFFGWLTQKTSPRTILLGASLVFIILSYTMNVILIHNVISTAFYLAHFAIVIAVAAYLATFE
jgi:Na+/melibiose symporter-like transporter